MNSHPFSDVYERLVLGPREEIMVAWKTGYELVMSAMNCSENPSWDELNGCNERTAGKSDDEVGWLKHRQQKAMAA